MNNQIPQQTFPIVETLDDLAKLSNYSLMDTLNCDPDAKLNGIDYLPRQVFTGHVLLIPPQSKIPSTLHTARIFFTN